MGGRIRRAVASLCFVGLGVVLGSDSRLVRDSVTDALTVLGHQAYEFGRGLVDAAGRVDLSATLDADWTDDGIGFAARLSTEGGTVEVSVTAEDGQPTDVAGFHLSLPRRVNGAVEVAALDR